MVDHDREALRFTEVPLIARADRMYVVSRDTPKDSVYKSESKANRHADRQGAT